MHTNILSGKVTLVTAVVAAEVKPAMFFCLHKLRYTLGQHAAQKAKVAHLIWVLFEYGPSLSHACKFSYAWGRITA